MFEMDNAASVIISAESDQSKGSRHGVTASESRGKTKRMVAIIVVIFFVTAAIVVGVLVASKNGSTDDTAVNIAAPTPLPTPNPTQGSTPLPTPNPTPNLTPGPTPMPILRGAKVESILADFDRLDAQAFEWLTDTDTWKPDEGDPNGDYLWLERYVMAELYFSTNGPNWTRKDNWLTSQPVCKWINQCPGPTNNLRL
ncbi:MAG: hypothetical protein SGBAC_011851, partial [Bacillariaceae sp.]